MLTPSLHRLSSLCLAIALLCNVACNKDDTIDAPLPPTIALDSETGIYTVKAGAELTVAPTVEHADGAEILWRLDGRIVCRTLVYTAVWEEVGDFYPVLTVRTEAGTVEEQIRVEVVERTPPVISLPVPPEGLQAVAGTELRLEPTYRYDEEPFRVEWLRDDAVVGTERSYVFRAERAGRYPLLVRATNADGTTCRELTIEVFDELPRAVAFPARSHRDPSTDRHTLVGRTLLLRPELRHFTHPRFAGSIDGRPTACTDPLLRFTPTAGGTYRIAVTVTEAETAASRTAEVVVHCSNKSERELLRPRTAGSSLRQQRVWEWTPAPGQFIGETGPQGGMTGNETTPEAADAWALRRLTAKLPVSLGGFGGYIVVGFDHSIPRGSTGYDFAIAGNAYTSNGGSSNEPGIVWVMQDTNGNGEPDDEWYELRGSETGKAETLQEYAVTYYRPAGPRMAVEWSDSEGQRGSIDYLPAFHDQESYYPAWIGAEAYTLRGTRLSAQNRLDPATGFWSNLAYAWGYADNTGSDRIAEGDEEGNGQETGFRIANAVYPDGTPVELQFIDFVKVQTGVNARSGHLGEISTEVCSFRDCAEQ